MALIYDISRLAKSGLVAQQSAQRDWSPFLVHFTSYSEMKPVRKLLRKISPHSAKQFSEELTKADEASFKVVQQILNCDNPLLRKTSPNAKEELPECVCLTECTFPGLFGHSERFGRFGFVFGKCEIFNLGGRPMAYVDSDTYGSLDTQHNENELVNRIWRFANVYRPIGCGQVQDFTVEREWRIFTDLPLQDNLRAVLAPDSFVSRFHELLRENKIDVPVLPIDMLYNWGV